jgi:hypothetical protein
MKAELHIGPESFSRSVFDTTQTVYPSVCILAPMTQPEIVFFRRKFHVACQKFPH